MNDNWKVFIESACFTGNLQSRKKSSLGHWTAGTAVENCLQRIHSALFYMEDSEPYLSAPLRMGVVPYAGCGGASALSRFSVTCPTNRFFVAVGGLLVKQVTQFSAYT